MAQSADRHGKSRNQWFWRLERIRREEHRGINPATGGKIIGPEKYRLAFQPGRKLMDKLRSVRVPEK